MALTSDPEFKFPKGALQIDDESSICSDVDAAALSELINETRQALALLDPKKDSLQWCSSAWSTAFPELAPNQSWSLTIKPWTALEQLYHEFSENQQGTASLWCDRFEQPRELTLSRLDSGLIALSLRDNLHANNAMHVYMEARETMFTTSRTISVSEMATTLAHEIKQPIATITNILKGVRILLKKGGSEEQLLKVQAALNDAQEQAEFTNSVINRIRDFTQARRPQQKAINVSELVGEALSLMDWLLNANQCRTQLTLSDEVLTCMGDPTMLQQVLINLLRNGVEAMHQQAPDDRVLIIECQRRGDSARISIRDNGHGLEGKEQSLFVPFTSSKASGMGVGLNICRSFVELHQGRLWLSPAIEGGCTSNMELPLIRQPPNEPLEVDESKSKRKST